MSTMMESTSTEIEVNHDKLLSMKKILSNDEDILDKEFEDMVTVECTENASFSCEL